MRIATIFRRRNGWRGQNGFTVLEVMIALVIALLSLTVFYASIASALGIGQSGADVRQAISSARSRLASLDNPGTFLGERRGQEANGDHWRTNVRLVQSTPALHAQKTGIWSRGTALYTVTVTEVWRRGLSEHAFQLESAVLGPLPVASP